MPVTAAAAAAPEGENDYRAAAISVLSAAALGELLGCSDRNIRDLTKRGILVAVGKNRYDVAASVPRYCEHLRTLATGRGGEAAIATGTAARAKRGSMVDCAQVQAEWSSILSDIRARLLAVPSRAAQRLPHLGAHDVGEIDAEVRAALQELGENRAA
jgi:phage terminase Nu1 subunit (DNA packaging protein)